MGGETPHTPYFFSSSLKKRSKTRKEEAFSRGLRLGQALGEAFRASTRPELAYGP